MESYPKYRYPEPVKIENRQWPDRIITKAPVWASVDLRDGNQALPEPMSPEHKLEYFKMLVGIGFKEIEVAFPSASADDFNFVRMLIERELIPEDVTISVLTQARKHLIDKTVESLRGVRRAIVHCYVPTSDLHGRFVFNHSREEVRQMAIDGTRMVREALVREGMEKICGYEFSPEEFTDSDFDFVVDVCCAVKQEWGPSTPETFILNLPATVERRPPNQYADLIELFCRKYPYLAETAISIHAHNDQGCAVAASELAILAGATRAEGTIFGHGERTGNLDIAVLALNLESRGVPTGLSFHNMFYPDPYSGKVYATALADLFKLYKLIPWGGEVVANNLTGEGTAFDGNLSLSAVAVKGDDGKLRVVITNRLPETARKISLDLGGRRVTHVYTLTADSVKEQNTAADRPVGIAYRPGTEQDSRSFRAPSRSITLLVAE